jgi:hypothetical protein
MKILFTIVTISYFNEEVNRNEPSPSVRVPCFSLKGLVDSDEVKKFDKISTIIVIGILGPML